MRPDGTGWRLATCQSCGRDVAVYVQDSGAAMPDVHATDGHVPGLRVTCPGSLSPLSTPLGSTP